MEDPVAAFLQLDDYLRRLVLKHLGVRWMCGPDSAGSRWPKEGS